MTTLVKTCADCGAEIELERPESRPEPERKVGTGFHKLNTRDAMVEVWERHVEHSDQLRCDECYRRVEAGEWEEQEARRREDRYEERVERSQMPKALHRVDFSGFTQPEAVEAVQRWIEGGGGLCLTGAVGVGKTHLAAAACWELLRERPVRWISVARLMSRMRMAFDDAERAQAMRVVTGEGALVLDDLDKANPTEFGREILFSAIDNRVEAAAPLLVTTNLRPSQLGDRLGDPIKSRLAGYCTVVEMVGVDRRVA